MHIIDQWHAEANMTGDVKALTRLDQFDESIAALSAVLRESKAFVRGCRLRGAWRKARRLSSVVKQQEADLRQLRADRVRFLQDYVPKK